MASFLDASAMTCRPWTQNAPKKRWLQCASTMIEAEPAVDLFLIECTNISPFKESLRAAFGLPVFDLVDALRETTSALACSN